MVTDKEQTILEHLTELRQRIAKSVLALLVGTILAMFFTEPALEFLQRPLGDKVLQTIYPTESLLVYFRIAFIGGIAIAMPVLVYQTVAFLLPGLLPEERKYLYFLIPGVTICFVAGVLFSALVMLPAAINFMQGFLETIVDNRWALDQYISFVTRVMFAMGVVFQTPLILLFLAKLGLVTSTQLRGFRKYAVLLTAVVAAIITPTPDPLNMALVMGPLYLLYEVGVLLVRITTRRQKAPETA
ncbi:MAG: twin-arginine translocase subunit TatC [Anaerolineae bacterium]